MTVALSRTDKTIADNLCKITRNLIPKIICCIQQVCAL